MQLDPQLSCSRCFARMVSSSATIRH